MLTPPARALDPARTVDVRSASTRLLRGAAVTLALCALVACAALPGRALTPQKIFERTVPSVVRIDAFTSRGVSIGTGFAISDSRIATNLHVIDGADRIVVQLHDGSQVQVRRVIAVEETQDLVILETSARGLRALPIADSSQLAEGQRIYAIGNPHGLDYTITDGLFSGRRRIEDSAVDLLQVSASLSRGSSGGPLLNERGEVVGVAARTFASERFGLGIPSNAVRRLAARAGSGLSFEEFVAERDRGAAKRPVRQVPNHPLEVVATCSDDEIRTLVVSILAAIERGAPAYNQGSPEDCYRIYEGTALRVSRELDATGTCGGGPALEAGLRRADGLESYDEKAWALRDTFDGLLDVIRRHIERTADVGPGR